MNGFGSDGLRCVDDGLDVQIALGRRSGTDAHRLIRDSHVQAFSIRLGIDRDRRYAEFMTAANQTDCDLPRFAISTFLNIIELCT